MQADNRGEGGILALLALVPQREREPAPGVLSATTVLVLIGAALLFGDGIITPAISVLSAVEGLRVAAPGLERAIVPATVVILAALFSVQSRGSGGLGRYFGPVMALWLGTAFVLGVIHIVARPQALTALSPHHGIEFLMREKFAAFRALGGVVLSVTGGEALYADMGHFGRRPIRVAWLTFALPALVTNYRGTGRVAARQQRCRAPAFLCDGSVGPRGSSLRPARHGGNRHRVPGAHFGCLLAGVPGDPARLLSPDHGASHIQGNDGADLRAVHERFRRGERDCAGARCSENLAGSRPRSGSRSAGPWP